MKSLDSSKIHAPTMVGLFHIIFCFFLVMSDRFSSITFSALMTPSDVTFKSSSSVRTKVTVTRFLKLSQSLPNVEFVISLKKSWSSFDVASCRLWVFNSTYFDNHFDCWNLIAL